MKAYRIVLTAAALVLAFGAQAQTNKEAIEEAQKQVKQAQQDLSDTQRKADAQIRDSQSQINAIQKELDVAQDQYNQGKKALSLMKQSLKAKQDVIKAGEKINITVPTGNFGNILAAHYAKRMGLPVDKLICASNESLSTIWPSGTISRPNPR